jgi:hypothetical protein
MPESTYPATLDALDVAMANEDDAVTGELDPDYEGPTGEGFHAGRHNIVASAVNAIEKELGTDPAGLQATVKARLEAIDLVLASAGTSISAAQGAIEAEVTRATAAEATKLAKASNLSDLANKATARSNLELGSAALLASSAFDASGAAAAAQAASQPLDSDLTTLAGITSSSLGQQLLAIASAAKAREAIEPTLNGFRLWKPQASTTINAANSTHMLRFEAPKNIVCRGLSFVLTSLATSNDACAIVMKAENGKTTLASSGSVTGKLNATVARQDIDFTEDVLLEAGKIYYPGLQFSTIGGTAAGVVTAETNNGNSIGGLFGTGAGPAYLGAPTTTYPWVGEPAFTIAQTRVYLIVRER